MAIDYKRQVINLYITETYCNTEKYSSKHRDLVERARCVIDPNRKVPQMRETLL